MKKLLILLIILMGVTVLSCTENIRARNFGGATTLQLPKGEKLINVTWKEADLWYLTRPMNATDTAVTYAFREESSFGIFKGVITIKELK